MDCFQILMVMIKLIEGLCTSLCVDRKVVYKSLCGHILSFLLSKILMGEKRLFSGETVPFCIPLAVC